jgi:predicted RNA binding protein YcfA (HicA-like mRNA interferase family)
MIRTGSHVILKKETEEMRVIVPFHNKDMKIGTLMSILKQANLTKKDFLNLWDDQN